MIVLLFINLQCLFCHHKKFKCLNKFWILFYKFCSKCAKFFLIIFKISFKFIKLIPAFTSVFCFFFASVIIYIITSCKLIGISYECFNCWTINCCDVDRFFFNISFHFFHLSNWYWFNHVTNYSIKRFNSRSLKRLLINMINERMHNSDN